MSNPKDQLAILITPIVMVVEVVILEEAMEEVEVEEPSLRAVPVHHRRA